MQRGEDRQGLYQSRFEHDACGVGFVVDIQGRRSHSILQAGLGVLCRMEHRGATGAEPDSGDGAGCMIQIPHGFLEQEAQTLGFDLPKPGDYGVGMIFEPVGAQTQFTQILGETAQEMGLSLLGWRLVPTHPEILGETARRHMPLIKQVFIGRGATPGGVEFEKTLYALRRRLEHLETGCYIASLSASTIVYKGMLTTGQLGAFYEDLTNPLVETATILVHSRFSTNTFPSWERAHPNRYLAHNGEINTVWGNLNWMNARQGCLSPETEPLLPIIDQGGSDSSMLDNTLEFLYLGGYSLPHAVMMLIPEPWSKHESITPEKRAFYEYHSCLMEPWDGPALVAFCDGQRIGAILDRNGLRPARYYLTDENLLVMASEVGVLEIPAEKIISKGRLQPGRMLLVDTQKQRIIGDEELKDQLARALPYSQWLDENLLTLDKLPPRDPDTVSGDLSQHQRLFGYTYEDLRKTLLPMAQEGVEPIGSMGVDKPLAILSQRPHLLYNYFHQLFAQVTNPALDAIREEIVTGSEVYLGSESDLLHPDPANCRRIKIENPILGSEELAKLKSIQEKGFQSTTLSILTPPQADLAQAMDTLFAQADQAIEEGANLLVISDRGAGPRQIPIPALLAVAGLHHHLIRESTRTKVSLILDSGEPREVHHFACLLGYGVDAIHPYLAYESIAELHRLDHFQIPLDDAVYNFRKASLKGIIKIMSKMGISTIQSYRGAQIFEAVGIASPVIDTYFTGTPSRIGGLDLSLIAKEAASRHDRAFNSSDTELDPGGAHQWRADGDPHLYNPETIHLLQTACRTNDYALYKQYKDRLHREEAMTLRSLLEFVPTEPIPLEEVEEASSIVKRFKTGAMSYGSISTEAHECLAIAMNRLGGKSNSGEGGEDPSRFTPESNGDSRCSAIKQVASGRFGVTSEYLVNAKEIQIKVAQGAKPGEGGQLPGRKVYPWVARTRHSTPGVGLISPPPHHDIYSIEDLAQLIHELKNANSQARICVKLVSSTGVGTIATGVVKGKADTVLISGYDGGTGASPRTSIHHAGLPWEMGLAETQQTLIINRLRDRVVLETDGKLMSGRDVAIAALLGAEEFGFATLPLVALGCVMMRVCNLDTCPVGIATQNQELRQNFQGTPEHVVNLMLFIAEDLREIMAQLGVRNLDEMVGQVELLRQRSLPSALKASTVDLSQVLALPQREAARRNLRRQEHGLADSLDHQLLLPAAAPTLESGEAIQIQGQIENTHRVVGTLLGSEITRRFGMHGLAEDTCQVRLMGSAGQSFGAFIPKGLTLHLVGDANDYLGKGLSGGKIILTPPDQSIFDPGENIIVGNVALYGATSGEVYICGRGGERFAVRNSGATAVIEGVGDHGCEYMTGGQVVVLGSTGRNFAAGMSGGVAYVYHPTAPGWVNLQGILLETPDESDLRELLHLIENHAQYTASPRAQEILAGWETAKTLFVKVIPRDYKRMVTAISEFARRGLSRDEAIMAAFSENSHDLTRVSGN